MINMSALKASIIAIFFVTTTIGNCLVLHVGRKHWGHTSGHITHFLVFHLSIADLIVTMFCMPFEFTEELLEKWLFGRATCKIIEYIQASALGASVYIITFIAVDRYLSIVRPLTSKLKARHGKYIVIFSWLVPVLVSTPYLAIFDIELEQHSFKNGTTMICETRGLPYPWLNKCYWVVEMYFTFILPLAIMTFCYSRLMKKILNLKKVGEPRQPSQHNQLSASSDPIEHNLRRIKLKSVKLTIAFVTIFIICWTPKIVLELMRITRGTREVHRRTAIYEVALFMSYMNETLNPVLYALFDPYFSDKIMGMFGKKERSFGGTTTDTSG
ncbi:orexin receptor type 1-like [Actinia tenebrosa]|uniref:Orexin receptor type 1-like n=1 Tax=Actinia tenebrosa TaxID=6105 RepID=A0A6P8IIP2_ACTTE|nr:orexin receptor type 1-like [Actinia tenebrosa]XP_031566393.1 orexin receptor type 1-like [Actinia tenebrosa]XP_031566394.1 orexin receptor type 1-like [Actinia tenebrosa]XP_031566395.1 orexin receptor type 1-like [Actinia tenebrosa]XP_031566397.1 orexin receptor type 1-like [Actinia tenebrosa]XP_031566398.1 orexin receptor type 1-like [Actinia tenebrosa]